MTRVKAERAAAMLAERHATDLAPDPVVTAEDWLTAHHAANTTDETHRDITETDLARADTSATAQTDDAATSAAGDGIATDDNDQRCSDTAIQRPADQADRADEADQPAVDAPSPERAVHVEHWPETGWRDIRDVAASEPAQVEEDVVRVPPAASPSRTGCAS